MGITPGAALGGGGSIVGITPGNLKGNFFIGYLITYFLLGAALEKKSVRDMAAGLNRLGGKLLKMFLTKGFYDGNKFSVHGLNPLTILQILFRPFTQDVS